MKLEWKLTRVRGLDGKENGDCVDVARVGGFTLAVWTYALKPNRYSPNPEPLIRWEVRLTRPAHELAHGSVNSAKEGRKAATRILSRIFKATI